jgi:hypothetical protein
MVDGQSSMAVSGQDYGKLCSCRFRGCYNKLRLRFSHRAVQDAMNLLTPTETDRNQTLPTASHLGMDVIHGSRHILELAKSLAEGL